MVDKILCSTVRGCVQAATQQTHTHVLRRILSTIDPNRLVIQHVQKISLRMARKCRNMQEQLSELINW
jgi:hypothetical protein